MAVEKRSAAHGLLAARLKAAKKGRTQFTRTEERSAADKAGASGAVPLSVADGDDSGDEEGLPEPTAEAESTAAAYSKLLDLLSSRAHTNAARKPQQRSEAGASHAAPPAEASNRDAGAEVGPKPGKQQQKRNPEETQSVPGTVQGTILQQPKAIPAEQLLRRHFDRQLTQAEVAQLKSGPPTLAPAEGAWPARVWRNATCLVSGDPLPPAPESLAEAGIQPRLITRWQECHAKAGVAAGVSQELDRFVSEEQRAFYWLCASYKDIFFPMQPYPTSVTFPDPLMDAALLHCINHVALSAACIKRNNEAAKSGDIDAETPRDQGFTRAKVLILLPLRSAALRWVTRLCQLAQRETRADSIQHKQRFLEEYGADEEEEQGEGVEGHGGSVDGGKGAKKNTLGAGKPLDHAALFAGNGDDHFRLGIKITRGAVKLYTDFLQADIIVASPIALATLLAEPDEDAEGGPADFLSSIEIALMDRADVLLMQNWAHVATVFGALNRVPEAQHGGDIMRVREAALSGWAGHLRQTVLLSSFGSAEMNALALRGCANWAGRVHLKPQHPGVLGQVIPQVHQVFERLPSTSPAADADARFERFRSQIWPRIRESGASGQLLFVSSYFDYVRLRNFLKEQGAAFTGLSEYAAPKQAARGRSLFADGRLRLALLTERCHFYYRARMRGIKDVLVYQLPHHAHFYAELVNCLGGGAAGGNASGDAQHATVTVLFSRCDAPRLEPVVGSVRAPKMLRGATATFLFC